MKRVLIVGGANGIGLSVAKELAAEEGTEKIYIIDKVPLAAQYTDAKITGRVFDLTESDYSVFDGYDDIDALFITVGFGRLDLFENIPEEMIRTYFEVNTIAVIRIIKRFYTKLLSPSRDFFCGVMASIAGFMSSPFFSVYGATKAALKIFIESVNVELEKSGTSNRILNVSPGSIKGTTFNNGQNDIDLTAPLAREIILHLRNKNDLFIPDYDKTYSEVLERYRKDFRAEGLHSYDFKLNSGRMVVQTRKNTDNQTQ